MRSSKSRSRNKSNRNRSVGNIVNRVFDSSGPEGKVRGTPQQIIEKYNQLARDAQLGNDRVAAENFQQHAEHYLRMLSEAQKEQDNRREQQEQENRQRQSERDRERTQRQERESNGDDGQNNGQSGGDQGGRSNNGNDRGNDRNAGGRDDGNRNDGQRNDGQRNDDRQPEPAAVRGDALDVVEDAPAEDSGLVETPENNAKPKPRRTYNRKPKAKADDGGEGGSGGSDNQQAAAE